MSQNATKFIAIEGHGGSGKSSLAEELSKTLRAEVIHIDDFTGQGSTDDWYKRLIELVLEPVRSQEPTVSYPRAQWWPEHRPTPVVDQKVTPVMIIEGVGSSRRELREFLSFAIFVDTPRDICIQRGLERDKGMGGKSDEQIRAMWEQWLVWDDEYFARDNPQDYADTTVSGTEPLSLTIDKIKSELRTQNIQI